MADGFFSGSDLMSKQPASTIPKCGACGLLHDCLSPKMHISGDGRKRILLVGEYPSESDDAKDKHFTSEGGRFLQRALRKQGVDMERDCWMTNAAICRPTSTPKVTEHFGYCRPNLTATIDQLNPEKILTFGSGPIRSIVKHIWRDEKVPDLDAWVGWGIPSQKLNAWLCPNYSPSFVLDEKRRPVLRLLFDNYLRDALALEERPWDEIPDWENDVTVELDSKKAARTIRRIIKRGGVTAFDYESNMLKPEFENKKIVCCSICWEGKYTIAYPWHGEAITATQEYLESDLPKIASNIKFEQRWTANAFGVNVNNWYWDTMQAAHAIDNRPNITSVKFQAFVLLGSGSYDDHISPYLKSGESSEANKVLEEITFEDLLLYCGMDSLLEYKVAMQQIETLGYPDAEDV